MDTVWINEGGQAKGLRVAVWGPALDGALLELSEATIGPDGAETRTRFVIAETGARTVAHALLPEFVLARAFEREGGPVSDEELRAIAGSMVRVQIEGAVRRAGRSVLRVSVCALDALEGDLLSVAVDLRR